MLEVKSVIKRIKSLRPEAEIAKPEFRVFLEKFESEINRGISTLCILTIINQANNEGIYGYRILKELEEITKDMLVIEEGTLYPILRKLETDGLIKSEKQATGRKRKYYFLTEIGNKIYNHMSGFFAILLDAISPMFDVNVNLKQDKYHYCPMCANKIDLSEGDIRFCTVCGYNLDADLIERRLKE
jgi:PadR family transcriptional regulator PadR